MKDFIGDLLACVMGFVCGCLCVIATICLAMLFAIADHEKQMKQLKLALAQYQQPAEQETPAK